MEIFHYLMDVHHHNMMDIFHRVMDMFGINLRQHLFLLKKKATATLPNEDHKNLMNLENACLFSS
jgi:hypothetical protein